MTGSPSGRAVVPDLVGLGLTAAMEAGHEAAVVVVSADVDGPPLSTLDWPCASVVSAQDPPAGSRVSRWDNVHVTLRRADGDEAGDREPRLPSPSPDGLEAYASPADARQQPTRRPAGLPEVGTGNQGA